MSALPPHTEALLYGGGDWRLPGADDKSCQGARFHSPRPLFTESTSLVLREWWPANDAPDAPPIAYWVHAPSAWLCGTCRDNLTILLQMMAATQGDLDWAVRREFGNDLRALALRGWSWFAEKHPDRVRPADSASATS